jgi:hypothetical protein
MPGEPPCYRCKRFPASELSVAHRSGGIVMRRCRNERDCDEYQLRQREALSTTNGSKR